MSADRYNTIIEKIPESLLDENNMQRLIDSSVIRRGAKLLQKGELVAFPTETVYGLGADASSAEAVEKIFEAKGRPQDNPLIVHIGERSQLQEIVDGQLPPGAKKLMDHFWPGPLTLIMSKGDVISDKTTAGLKTVAVRMPSHPAALALIRASGLPVSAPSANISGRPSPTRAEHVYKDLQGRIPYIIDGGHCPVGVESTVLDLRKTRPIVLRPGGIPREKISDVLNKEVKIKNKEEKTGEETPLSPGMKYRHYAPEAPIKLFSELSPDNLQIFQQFLIKEEHKRIALILSREGLQILRDRLDKKKNINKKMNIEYGVFVDKKIFFCAIGSRKDSSTVARRLFHLLRYFDDNFRPELIIIEELPTSGLGEAVMNRLHKAAEDYIYLKK